MPISRPPDKERKKNVVIAAQALQAVPDELRYPLVFQGDTTSTKAMFLRLVNMPLDIMKKHVEQKDTPMIELCLCYSLVKDANAGRCDTVQMILDRLIGKPHYQIHVSNTPPPTIIEHWGSDQKTILATEGSVINMDEQEVVQ